jgi:hypothetical protein
MRGGLGRNTGGWTAQKSWIAIAIAAWHPALAKVWSVCFLHQFPAKFPTGIPRVKLSGSRAVREPPIKRQKG